MLFRRLVRTCMVALAAVACGHALALTPQQARELATGEIEARINALNAQLPGADEKTVALIQAMADDAVKFTDTAVFVMKDDKGYDPVTGAELPVPETAEDIINNNEMRSELDAALASIKLFSPDDKVRAEAVKTLQEDPQESKLPLVEKAFAAEAVPTIKDAIARVRAAMLLGSADKAKRLEAATSLGATGTPATKTLLLERQKVETEADVKAALASRARPDRRAAWPGASGWA